MADWLVFVYTINESDPRTKYQDAVAFVRADEETVKDGVEALNLRFKSDEESPEFLYNDWREMDTSTQAWARLSLVEYSEKAGNINTLEPWSGWRKACKALWEGAVFFRAPAPGIAAQVPPRQTQVEPLPAPKSKLQRQQDAVLEMLRGIAPGDGLQSKQISAKMPDHLKAGESSIRRHVIPPLIRAQKIVNTPGIGYHLPI